MAHQVRETGQALVRKQVGLAADASVRGDHASAANLLRKAKAGAKRCNIWGDNRLSAMIETLLDAETKAAA